jgi:hypothetical protein
MATISKHQPHKVSLRSDSGSRPMGLDLGKADDVGEVTGRRTLQPDGIMAQASWERLAEITSGRTSSQQGLAATCKDRRKYVWIHEVWRRERVWRMSS